MADQPEWMPTSEEMLSAWARNNLLTMSSPSQFDAIAMLTARKIAEWLKTIGSERHHSAFGDTIWAIPINEWEQFILEAEKGKSA